MLRVQVPQIGGNRRKDFVLTFQLPDQQSFSVRFPTRRVLVYASIVAVVFLELWSMQQGEVLEHSAPQVAAACQSGVGPRLSRPRVMPPTAPAISVRVANFPGSVTTSHAGHLPPADGVVSLQDEHVRLEI